MKNKPLIEAIFEIKWKPSAFNGIDRDLRLFLGKFQDYISKDYPAFEVTANAVAPEQMSPHVALYRFRKSENGWPLVQLGSGVLTLNDTAEYTWDEFRQRALSIADLTFHTYPAPIELQSLELRYINAVTADFNKEDIGAFLSEKFRLAISPPQGIFESKNVQPQADYLNLQSAFPTVEPKGTLRLNFGRGKANDKDALIWETIMNSASDDLPQMPRGLESWLDAGHEVVEDCFFKLVEGDLLRQFA